MPQLLILGSSSPYRAAQLKTLGLAFEQISPNIDETAHKDEAPEQLAGRLALAKATAIAMRHPGALVIGSDQVGTRENQRLSKPGNIEAAMASLRLSSGKTATFYTAVTLARLRADGELAATSDICKTQLKFRQLTEAQITLYVAKDQTTDVAGAFKAESLGIALFEYVRSDDPSALIGLPLIALTKRLQQFGVDPLSAGS